MISPITTERKVAPPPAPSFVPQLLQRKGLGEAGIPGKRSAAYSHQGAAIRPIAHGAGLHLVGTILRAVERGAHIDAGMLQLQPDDLRGALRRGKQANLIVFVVDASGSMAGQDRLAAVTGAVLSMLRDAYQRRDKVAVIAVRGADAQLVLPPTNSIDIAVRRLEKTATGGRTPLSEGLELAHEVIERERRREPARRALLVVLSDGRATTGRGMPGVERAARGIAAAQHCGSLVIDCEQARRVRLGLAKRLAQQLQAPCIRLEHLQADAVQQVVRAL